jgi:3-deoxy-manno-octulosonate cytidylyltransferase (CMP-KDO synthetase)
VAVPFADDGPREGTGSPMDPNCVKVVVDATHRAIYFSRSLIPFPRDTGGIIDRPSRWLLHLGVYAFRVSALREITETNVAPRVASDLALRESLEQLRWLSSGQRIGVMTGKHRSMGIDTPEQYGAFVERFARNQERRNRNSESTAIRPE